MKFKEFVVLHKNKQLISFLKGTSDKSIYPSEDVLIDQFDTYSEAVSFIKSNNIQYRNDELD